MKGGNLALDRLVSSADFTPSVSHGACPAMSKGNNDHNVALQVAKRVPPTKFNKMPAAAMVARNSS